MSGKSDDEKPKEEPLEPVEFPGSTLFSPGFRPSGGGNNIPEEEPETPPAEKPDDEQ
jgi:hypothetical protein